MPGRDRDRSKHATDKVLRAYLTPCPKRPSGSPERRSSPVAIGDLGEERSVAALATLAVSRRPEGDSGSPGPRPSSGDPPPGRPPCSPGSPPAPAAQPASADAPAPLGALLGGKYRFVRLLGRGGVGEVCEAVHAMIGHRVAIKLLRPEYAGNAELAARFLQEALAAAAIGHPGIVKVFDAGVGSDGRAYVVMEFLEGEDLQKLQTRQRRLAVADAAEIFVDVLDALAATHAAGIVHRDMKPENVFLARGPRGARVVKLLDFGVARLAEGSPQSLRLTRPGAVIGTPYYMAPEQARGKRPVDGAVDVYAVGVMLFESLCGRLPFTGGTHEAVLARVLSEPFPKARTFQPDLPAGLEAIIARATARQPAERFADAAEFARALAGFAPSRESAWRVPEPDGTPRVAPAIPPPPGTEAEAEVLVVDVGPAREAAPASPPPPPRRPSPAPVRTSTPPGTPVRVPTPARPPRRPASTPPPRHVVPSLGRQIAVFLTGAVVAAVLVLAGVLIGLRLREPEEAAGVAGAVGGAAGIVPAAAAPAQVRIRVLGAPPAAEIRFDGRPVAPDFSVPVAGDEHVLEVRVPDRPPLVRRVRPTADLTIDLAAASGPPPAP